MYGRTDEQNRAEQDPRVKGVWDNIKRELRCLAALGVAQEEIEAKLPEMHDEAQAELFELVVAPRGAKWAPDAAEAAHTSMRTCKHAMTAKQTPIAVGEADAELGSSRGGYASKSPAEDEK